MNIKKHFTMKSKKGFFKHVCVVKFLKFIVKLDKILHKLDKHLKFTKSKKTMEILQDKSKLRETILLVKDAIIPNPNTMKSNAAAS